jgi:hypothetical protein
MIDFSDTKVCSEHPKHFLLEKEMINRFPRSEGLLFQTT